MGSLGPPARGRRTGRLAGRGSPGRASRALPEAELGLFAGLEPDDNVVELGCGTAAISAWLARGGTLPVAVDISRAQLETVRRLQQEFDLSFPLVCENAETLAFADDSFDLAVSEYGASLWCDPSRWVPEAHRLLRPRGRLVFLTNSALLWPARLRVRGTCRDRARARLLLDLSS